MLLSTRGRRASTMSTVPPSAFATSMTSRAPMVPSGTPPTLAAADDAVARTAAIAATHTPSLTPRLGYFARGAIR